MDKKTFFLITLFSYSFLEIYFPLIKKEIDLNIDNLCYYTDDGVKAYVKACDKGYYCPQRTIANHKIGICLEYNPGFKKYKEECSKDSECDVDLKCIDKLCIVKEGEKPYIYTDKASEKDYFYCSDGANSNDSGGQTCQKSDKHECFKKTLGNKFYSSEYLKVCGKFNDDKTIVSTSDIGELEDGSFVADALACKSGFTLYFDNHQRCVTIKGVEKYDTKCLIRYTIGNEEEEFIYYPNEPSYSNNKFKQYFDCNVIMTEIELFQDYLSKFNKLKAHCEEKKFYNEPFTCENDELRKIWYYYNHPEDYLSYKDDEEILDYLVAEAYPTPKSKLEEEEKNKKNSSGFLVKNYFLLLLLLAF